jgi:hypothetical protein
MQILRLKHDDEYSARLLRGKAETRPAQSKPLAPGRVLVY